MIPEYLNEAMSRATYMRLPEGGYYGTIPGFHKLYGIGESKVDCREDLRSSLEKWLLRRVADHESLPHLGELTLEF